MDDYYSILGVRADVDDDELRRVWRELAMKWHPDRAGRGGGDDPYSAWLAVRPGVVDGTVIRPSAQLPDAVRPVSFRVRI